VVRSESREGEKVDRSTYWLFSLSSLSPRFSENSRSLLLEKWEPGHWSQVEGLEEGCRAWHRDPPGLLDISKQGRNEDEGKCT